MLIGNSLPEYIVIRIVIFGLRAIAPISIAYSFVAIWTQTHRKPQPWEIYLFLEAAFFSLIYLPARWRLQSAADHPKASEKPEREVLFQRILESVSAFDNYLSGWFLGIPANEIGRHGVKEFLAWSFLNKHPHELDEAEDTELEGYIDRLEARLERKLEISTTPSLRTTFDAVPMQHRPLLWYLIVMMVELVTHIRLLLHGLRLFRPSLVFPLLSFPPRLLALYGHSQNPEIQLSYWYKEHRSETKHPIVFIHGIGIGLFPYVDFLSRILANGQDDEDVGLIVLEILPISSRICRPALTTKEMQRQVQLILDSHGWTDFVLIGHSYGTALASTILRDEALSKRVQAAMLIDPICFLLHMPDVAYNFTRRKPRRANERMLDYFSSQDMLISHTLARRFFWTEYILWKEDLDVNRPLTVVLSEKDLIVPTREVWTYLTGTMVPGHQLIWKDGQQQVFWLDNLDHAGLFNSRDARRSVAAAAKDLCSRIEECG